MFSLHISSNPGIQEFPGIEVTASTSLKTPFSGIKKNLKHEQCTKKNPQCMASNLHITNDFLRRCLGRHWSRRRRDRCLAFPGSGRWWFTQTKWNQWPVRPILGKILGIAKKFPDISFVARRSCWNERIFFSWTRLGWILFRPRSLFQGTLSMDGSDCRGNTGYVSSS